MSELLKAAEDLKKVGRALGKIQFEDIAAGLEAAHSIAQAKDEQATILAHIKEEIGDARAELDKVKAQVKKASADAQERFENESKASASIHALGISKAKEEADNIIATANAQRDAVLQEIDNLNRQVNVITEQIKSKSDELFNVNANLEQIKARAQQLLGA